MAKRRVQNGKRVERETVTTADGRTIGIDIYMVKPDRYSLSHGASNTTSFVAICDEIDLEEKGDDIDEVTKRAVEIAKRRDDVSWEPWLLITVKGTNRELSAKQLSGELFDERGYTWGDSKLSASFKIEVEVESIQRAKIEDCWRWRNPPNVVEKAPIVHFGTPELGGEPQHYRNERKSMRALIPDTPKARSALLSIRAGFIALEEKLADLLSPEQAEASLFAIYGGATVPSLTPGPKGRVRAKKSPHA